MADETRLTAASRIEKLLDNIAGGDNEVTPATRLEKFLSYIADAMEGGGGCDGEIDMSGLLPIEIPGAPSHGDLYVYTGAEWELVGVIDRLNAPNPEKGLYFKFESIPNCTRYALRFNTITYENAYVEGVEDGLSRGFYLMDTGNIIVQCFSSYSDYFYFTDISGKNVEYRGGVE